MRSLTLAPLSQWGLFGEGKQPLVVAGPCAAESREQTLRTARELAALGVEVFRAGLWKPRTHPGAFEGAGAEGLPWLLEAKKELGLKVATEVACASHIRYCLRSGVDMLWIGARTSANPFMVQELADALQGADIPVFVKNPVNPDLEQWLGALERLNAAGVKKLGVILRGYSTLDKQPYRNAPGWELAVELRSRCPELPFLADPSHIAGDRAYVRELSVKALRLGLDGLMIEAHCEPDKALSDPAQQLRPSELKSLLEELAARGGGAEDSEYKAEIERLRARLDLIDERLLEQLESRMDISREIGRLKSRYGVALVQPRRWESVLASMVARGAAKGLSEGFVKAVFAAIHEESVGRQGKEI